MIAYLAALLTVISVWAFLYALNVVGVHPESLTRRVIAFYRRKPIEAAFLTLLLLALIGHAGTKGPIIRPPIAVHTIPIWRNPVDGFLWPVWRRYRLQMIQQAPIIPKEPEGEEGDE